MAAACIRVSAPARSRSATGSAPRTSAAATRETTAALTTVVCRVCGVDRVEIHVDPANVASLRIPRALGFTEEGTLCRRLPSIDGRSATPWSHLLADELEGSAAARVAVDAFDAAGRAIPL